MNRLLHATCAFGLLLGSPTLLAQRKGNPEKAASAALTYPPALPGGEAIATGSSPKLLQRPEGFPAEVPIAKEAPVIDIAYFPGQDERGKPWSAWGDSIAANGKYYASIGNHHAPDGNAFVYEYDPATRKFRQLLDLKKLLNIPAGEYTPGKIHSRLDLGDDGWLYCSTHRGSTRVTTDEYHYQGDWIVRCDPRTGAAEIVTQAPVPKHCIPCGMLDPKRLIFYGGTAPGTKGDPKGIQFFAYDVVAKKLLYAGPNGPARYLMHAASTGRVYYTATAKGEEGDEEEGALMRYDPAQGGAPVAIPGKIGVRTATRETPDGIIYTVSEKKPAATLYAFNTRTEEITDLGSAAVGSQQYITTIDADASGRFLYYIPGAHGGSDKDGTPIVQFDTRSKTKKVIAFLHPYDQETYGLTLQGTFSTALDPAGDKLYITWNSSRTGQIWDSCVLTVVHIPESERME